MQHHVLDLEIAMHGFNFMQAFETVEYLLEVVDC
jgi:hypothetical protein